MHRTDSGGYVNHLAVSPPTIQPLSPVSSNWGEVAFRCRVGGCREWDRPSGRRRGRPHRPPTTQNVQITYPAFPVCSTPHWQSALSLFLASCHPPPNRHPKLPSGQVFLAPNRATRERVITAADSCLECGARERVEDGWTAHCPPSANNEHPRAKPASCRAWQ
jgi:hypothetical protein